MGASLGVQAGTRLVFDFGSAAGPIVRVVTTVTPDFAAGRTVVDLAPLGPLGVDEALQQLTELVDNASSDLPPPGPIAQGVYTILTAFRDAANAENADVFTAVADLVRQVTEALAIAANRVPPGVVSWLAGAVTRVLDQARTTLSLMSQDERRLAPDIDYLQRLARALTCTPAELRRDPAACDRAAPLMTAAAILPALRRPPSQPPVTSAALPQAASAALDPQSSAVTAILAAADPRLAGVLGQAVGQQTATAPPATASVIALKTKANPLAEGDNADPTRLLLDGTADSLVPRSWVVSEENSWDGTTWTTQAYANRIVSARQFTRQVQLSSAGPTTNVPTTEVTLDGDAYAVNGGEPTDQLTVYYGGAPVPLADETITDDVGGAEIELARTYDGLRPAQRLLITGERTDIPGTPGIIATELTMVGGVDQRLDRARPGDATLPVLVLATPLAYTYKRETVTINGNVAAATQGESRSEVLGSGAASQAGQSFPLKQVSATSPLTWLPGDNALGAADTLTVRVNGVEWHESDDLSQAGPNDREYRTAVASDGSVSVLFGDGAHGSRLPTGQENVTAAYRVGGGAQR